MLKDDSQALQKLKKQGLVPLNCQVAFSSSETTPEKELGCAEGGMGVHTADDVRCYLAQFPAEFVRPINDEITVLFTNPDSLAEWIGGAVIYHIPSVSTVTLDFNGDVDLRHTEFKDHSATIAFERPRVRQRGMGLLNPFNASSWGVTSTQPLENTPCKPP